LNNRRTILLIEDDHVDAMTVSRAFKEINAAHLLQIVHNGEEALAYLQKEQSIRPSIILLDLNMPKMNGIEFLRIVKKDNTFKNIPVIVLTSSQDEEDKNESYAHSVAGYIIKPADYCHFIEVVRIIDNYWTLSELPQ